MTDAYLEAALETQRELDRAASIEPGWALGDGIAITTAAKLTARSVLAAIVAARLPLPSISPHPSGSLDLSWENGARIVDVQATATGTLEGGEARYDETPEDEDVVIVEHHGITVAQCVAAVAAAEQADAWPAPPTQ